jgi:hypothetical protein
MTTGVLPPSAVPAWLRSLSLDVRAVAVLDAAGAVLAGDPALGARAARALAPAAGDTEQVVGDGLLAVRSARHAVAVAVGPLALVGLHLADLRAVVAALDAAPDAAASRPER